MDDEGLERFSRLVIDQCASDPTSKKKKRTNTGNLDPVTTSRTSQSPGMIQVDTGIPGRRRYVSKATPGR